MYTKVSCNFPFTKKNSYLCPGAQIKFFLSKWNITRGNSKNFLPPGNGGKKVDLELSFKTKSPL